MKKYLLLLLVALSVFSCKDPEEDTLPIDNPDIIGTWKRQSKGIVNGSDTTYVNYSEDIYHQYFQGGTYTETKSGSSILNSEANYQFSLVNDSLKFYSMGAFSHAYPIKLFVTKLYIDMGIVGSSKITYRLIKQ
ncbi:MAG: hypothetical protein ABIJ97_02695 [Bacteroidota bacterium]